MNSFIKFRSGKRRRVWPIQCLSCGVDFEAIRETARFCSNACHMKHSYSTGQRDRTTICLAANEASEARGYEYRIGREMLKTRGERHHAWKGGVTSANNNFRKSVPYKLWRTEVFERDNYTCTDCGVRGGYLEADHIKPFSQYPELRLDLGNGRTLCKPCHQATPTYGWKLVVGRAA